MFSNPVPGEGVFSALFSFGLRPVAVRSKHRAEAGWPKCDKKMLPLSHVACL